MMAHIINQEHLRNMYLSSSVVTDVEMISEVLPDSDAVVTSNGIYEALSNLSANIMLSIL